MADAAAEPKVDAVLLEDPGLQGPFGPFDGHPGRHGLLGGVPLGRLALDHAAEDVGVVAELGAVHVVLGLARDLQQIGGHGRDAARVVDVELDVVQTGGRTPGVVVYRLLLEAEAVVHGVDGGQVAGHEVAHVVELVGVAPGRRAVAEAGTSHRDLGLGDREVAVGHVQGVLNALLEHICLNAPLEAGAAVVVLLGADRVRGHVRQMVDEEREVPSGSRLVRRGLRG